jgi:hypothetical protein
MGALALTPHPGRRVAAEWDHFTALGSGGLENLLHQARRNTLSSERTRRFDVKDEQTIVRATVIRKSDLPCNIELEAARVVVI